MRSKILNIGLPILILTLSILGARLPNTYILYSFLALVCVSVILAVLDKLEEKHYPYLIFAIGLGLLYQTTLLGAGVVGTDVHGELYHAWTVWDTKSWVYYLPLAYNAALGSTLLVPLLAWTFHIDIAWVFKQYLPIFLAIVPVILYYIFKERFGTKEAFLSVFFFLSIPTWLTELPALGKQQVAELFFILCLLLVISRIPKITLFKKLILIGVLGILTSLAHYTLGVILMLYLVPLPIILLILRRFGKPLIPIKHLTLAILAIVIGSLGFFGWVASGYTLSKLICIGGDQLNMITGTERFTINLEDSRGLVSPSRPPPPDESPQVSTPETSSEHAPSRIPVIGFFKTHQTIVKIALGFDFMERDIYGKTFRVFQYLTQLLLVIGCAYILVRWRRLGITPEYFGVFLVAGAILCLVAFLPGFSAIVNATRFYHLVLFFLAPALIMGGKLIARKFWGILILCILIPYFLFTSGIIFEVSQQPNIREINIPYTHALSAVRIDTAGITTEEELGVRDWIYRNKLEEVYTDVHGVYLLAERLGPYATLNFLPWDLQEVPDNSHIFLRERNEEEEELTYWTGIGTRYLIPYEELGMELLLEGRELLYQEGEAKVYGPKY